MNMQGLVAQGQKYNGEKVGQAQKQHLRGYRIRNCPDQGSDHNGGNRENPDCFSKPVGKTFSVQKIPGGFYYDKEHMVHCFSYFLQHRRFLDGLFHCGFGDIFLKYMTVYMMKFWNNYERRKLQAFAGVLYALYISWSRSGYRESTEEMAQLVGSLCCWD